MSFGYSIGDIVSLVQLAWKTVQNSRKACGEHAEFTREASSLHVVIQRLEKESSKSDSPIHHPGDKYKEELQGIVGGCSEVLTALNRGLEKYNTLSKKRTSARKLLHEVLFGNGEMPDMRHLREQMTYYTTSLSLFLNTVSMGSIGRVERQMEKTGADIEEIRIAVNRIRARLSSISNRDSILTTYEDDDKAVWKEFRKELYQEGFSSAIIKKYKPLIKDYIRELEDRELLDDETSPDLEEMSEVAGTLTSDRSSKVCREEEPSSGAKSSSIPTPQLPPRPESVDQYIFQSGLSRPFTSASPKSIYDECYYELGEILEDTDLEEELSSGAESSSIPTPQLPSRSESVDQYVFRSGLSKPFTNASQRLTSGVCSRERGERLEDIEEESSSDAESSFMSTSQLSPRRGSSDQYSSRSKTSNSSIYTNPRHLETAENAIHRLIMPELEILKPEQKIQQSRQEFDRGRSFDSPFERRSDCAMCVEDVTSDEEEFFENRSKEHRVKDGGESFTAWLLNAAQ